MATVRAQLDFEGTPAEAEALWFDLDRWPSFVDGFGHLGRVEANWPDAGGRLVWDSLPKGRGRVVERVVERVQGEGQIAEVEDPRLRGTQRLTFTPLEDGVGVTLELEYDLKQGGPLRRLTDALFVRRAIGDSLRRTLIRFGRELEADRELLR